MTSECFDREKRSWSFFDEITKDYTSFSMAMVWIIKLGKNRLKSQHEAFEYVVTLASTMSNRMRTPTPAPAQRSMDASVPLTGSNLTTDCIMKGRSFEINL